ncbi:hypothetical protein SISSUDRAFT_1043959 [Sistotremastrum suecicum HHB10207 ss-3]|uniref:Uncharacterized protein n=1 Tax=Sistotremastrum suecicum HHB10207 ss-3 TaxID=1314776 RepID=A0A166FGX3_9AGAM|nr:hypothetical protein SISSUDRAFT_1043959 [Sistotremastrum suecicum HHB10207 ss-3]
MKLYRLSKAELPDSFQTSYVTVANVPTPVPKYNYDEIDVERAAWRKYGGPEGFEAYLEYLYQIHENRNTDAKFLVPFTYALKYSAGNTWGRSRACAEMKAQFPSWLWTACNEDLDWWEANVEEGASYDFKEKRADALRLAKRRLVDRERYPARSALLPPSLSVSYLRAVLSQAPTSAGLSEEEKDARFSVVRDNIHDSWTEYYWKQDYLTPLFEALIGVIEEHGIEGWKSVRWEVYDKFRECQLATIHYRPEGRHGPSWEDEACAWLKGYMEPSPGAYLQRRRQHQKVEAGRR